MEEESQHIVSSDSCGRSLEGDKSYKLYLPPDIPARKFWSVIVYDKSTCLMICTDQPWPSVFSSCKKLFVNKDGSVEIYFGPKAPEGNIKNWILTIPGKSWYMILRLYGPEEPWFNKTWRPGEIDKVS